MPYFNCLMILVMLAVLSINEVAFTVKNFLLNSEIA